MCIWWHYPRTAVQTDVDSTAEEDVIAFGKFESSETGRQRIAIDRIEILKEIRIDWTPALRDRNVAHQMAIQFSGMEEKNEPVEDNGLLFGQTIGDVHVGNSKTVSRRAVWIEENLHLK